MDVTVAPDGTLEAFTAALEGAEGLDKLQPTSMCALGAALHRHCLGGCLPVDVPSAEAPDDRAPCKAPG